MTAADLVSFLMSGGKLSDLQNDPRFANAIEVCRCIAEKLLDELGTVVETDGRSVHDVLHTAPLRRRVNLKVMKGGRR
jgi:hypothetical protein